MPERLNSDYVSCLSSHDRSGGTELSGVFTNIVIREAKEGLDGAHNITNLGGGGDELTKDAPQCGVTAELLRVTSPQLCRLIGDIRTNVRKDVL